jgi:hypothetical protein
MMQFRLEGGCNMDLDSLVKIWEINSYIPEIGKETNKFEYDFSLGNELRVGIYAMFLTEQKIENNVL